MLYTHRQQTRVVRRWWSGLIFHNTDTKSSIYVYLFIDEFDLFVFNISLNKQVVCIGCDVMTRSIDDMMPKKTIQCFMS